MKIISRKEAKEKGLKTYFTGKPCKWGKYEERRVSSTKCLCENCMADARASSNESNSERRRAKAYKKRIDLEKELEYDYFPNKVFWEHYYQEYQKHFNVISRKEAIEKGLKFYFTGIPCKHGHLAKRKTTSHSCVICQKISRQNYDKRNPESFKKRKNRSVENWSKKNPELNTILQRHRVRIRDMVMRGQGTKPSSSRQQIGCTPKELVKHIENQFKKGMSWENKEKWHIDHIRPCESFDLFEKDQQLVCFNWRNMQPLWSKKNMSKNDRYTPLDETAWVERMLSLGYEGELFLKYEEGNSY